MGRKRRLFRDCVPTKPATECPPIGGVRNDDDEATAVVLVDSGDRKDDDRLTGEELTVVDGDH